jgi:hypothetical protein
MTRETFLAQCAAIFDALQSVPDMLLKVLDLEPVAVSVKKAAQMVDLSPSTLNDMRVDGDGPPFIYIRGAVRYLVDDLRAWASERPRFRSVTEARVFEQIKERGA